MGQQNAGSDEVPRHLFNCLRLAGTELIVFTNPAVEGLFQATNGMPRKVNRLAHHAMTAAALDGKRQVDDQHLHAAPEDLRP